MALVFVLIMISIVFVIAAASSRLVTLGERSARNDRDRQTAFQAAETALSDAEIDIMGPSQVNGVSMATRVSMFGGLPAGDGCSSASDTRGYCSKLSPSATDKTLLDVYRPIFSNEDESTRQWVKFGEFTSRLDDFPVSTSGALPVKTPRYIIEKSLVSFRNRAATVGKPFDAFIITAVGYGLQPGTQVVLQAMISKPVPTN
jgi:type IV pilus assembly protein PilX